YGDIKRKFRPQHEYLSLVIPSTWLLIGLFFVDFCFYGADHVDRTLRRLIRLQPYFSSAISSLDFFLALFLFIAVFSVLYVIGQMINGMSALVIDRVLVKKLLKYPFELYGRRLASDVSDDHQFFRDAVLDSSYLIFCLNLIPVAFVELSAALLSFRIRPLHPQLSSEFLTHFVSVAVLLAGLSYLHFGWPSLRKPHRYPEHGDSRAATHYQEFYAYHWTGIGIVLVFEFVLVAVVGWVPAILLFPAINIVIGLAEKLGRTGTEYKSAYVRRFYFYLRLCFANLIYFAANVSGYGTTP